jgi:predicted DNA-binding transcriptional regulator YafY
VRLLLRLLAAPRRHTRKELAAFLGVPKPDTVTGYMDNLRAAGIDIDFDEHHRYYVVPRRGFRELDYLAPLTDKDKARLKSLLDRQLSTPEATQLYNKLESLYDYQQLGLEALREPEIEKINDIEQACREKRRVLLVNYRSRSGNDVRDRKVEAFALETDRQMIRAYDVAPDKRRTSFFMLSRTERIILLDEPWMCEQEHYYRQADAFNIVMDKTELVRLTLRVSAYNDLIERHPQTRQHIRPGKEVDTYDFQGRINAKFIGLLPFLLANFRHVEVHGPAVLRERLGEEIGALQEWWGGGD